MCGLVVRLGKDLPIEDALDSIRYRGTQPPIVTNTMIGKVGHVRLPIVGLDPAHDQPVTSLGRTIAFVGELLDFRDKFPLAECDTDIVANYIGRGELHKFTEHDGFWSVAWLDVGSNTLNMLCDYLAQKPLYYRNEPGIIACASEPAALLHFGRCTWDEVYMSAVTKWGYCPDTNRTPWREIRRVQPGEYVRIYETGRCVREVIDPISAVYTSPADMRQEIEAAVRRRALSADVPVACLLSGGLDSSIVYSIAKRYGDVRPYYVLNSQDAEELRAHKIAGDSALTIVRGSGVELGDMIDTMQEPVDLGSLAPQISLSREIEERVCLTGDGADECFGGYGRYAMYDAQGSDIFQELVSWHLPRLDRVMMRQAIEVRSPFLARNVVQGALALPWQPERQDKHYLRELFRGELPDEIVRAPKVPLRTAQVEAGGTAYRLKLIRAFRGGYNCG